MQYIFFGSIASAASQSVVAESLLQVAQVCTKNHMDVTNTIWLGHESIRESTSESIREREGG
jgi:hypothetical protein